jgi:adenine-specific DNA-methyltransferase
MRKKEEQSINKTELIWPGKRKEVERVELPFQTIEILNLPRGSRQENIFENLNGQKKLVEDGRQLKARRENPWKNRLIWGDNLLVMGSLLKEFAGKINLIYIDPPFATGDDFSFTVNIGDGAEVTKEPSALEVKAYRDTWGKGMQSYLQMIYDRLVLMKELLADDGTIFVHIDYRVVHYIKQIMDEIFGKENLVNEIIWFYSNAGGRGPTGFARKHDTLLFYRKNDKITFNWKEAELTREAAIRKGTFGGYFKKDKDGREYQQVRAHGKIYKYYLDDFKLPEDVWEIQKIAGRDETERTGYATQKPKKLLERVIKVSSNKDDLVADFFCGSGTTGVVAEKLNRRWIMSDLGRFAIHTTRKRLLDMSAKPFVVQNLGKYERHRWAKLNGKYKDYTKFILELYHAELVDGFTRLHGKKGKSFVRVGAVDAPVTLSEIRGALEECKENKIKRLDVLGWEWEMGLHDLVKEEAEKYGVKLATFQIPREVMELNVEDQKIKEDVQFYELAYLEIKQKVKNKKVIITLKDFIIPNPELLPEEIKVKVKNWSDFIDYWAVDWMFNQHEEWTEEDDTFHNMNQRYRTRKEPKLELLMNYEYKKAGKYNILVKVIDIFGNDTTKLIEIKV